MAAITFDSMVADISGMLPGCPSLTISITARKMAIDLCQRAKVWQVDLPVLPLIVGTTDYTPVSPVVYGEYSDFLSGYIVVDGKPKPLAWRTYDKTRRMFPDWPLGTNGEPTVITTRAYGTVSFAQTPDQAYNTYIRACLRPTRTATSWDADLYAEFHREIFHGVLHELMSMPERSWTDQKLGAYHGKQWTYLLALAKDRAERGYNVDAMQVDMRPFA